jgi:leader peptidase (prepilin peptidase)/N-methyltransferase
MDPAIVVLFGIYSFCLGACIGSFLNVCIFRIPDDRSIVRPRSHCPNCKTPIAWYDNIPLLSYLLLAAKCRHCKTHISARYPLVEFLTATLFLLVWLKFTVNLERPVLGLAPIWSLWLIPIYWLIIGGLVAGTFIDIDHMILPDGITIGGAILGIVLSAIVPELHGKVSAVEGLLTGLIGAAVGGGMLWAIAGIGTFIFKKPAMGMGDVKLMAAIGAFMGWTATIFTLMMSSLIGAIFGLALVIGKGKEMQSRIPYGPFLAMAAVVWILWGPAIADLYVRYCWPMPEGPM